MLLFGAAQSRLTSPELDLESERTPSEGNTVLTSRCKRPRTLPERGVTERREAEECDPPTLLPSSRSICSSPPVSYATYTPPRALVQSSKASASSAGAKSRNLSSVGSSRPLQSYSQHQLMRSYSPSSPMQRSSHQISSYSIDFGPSFQEQLAGEEMIVDGCPMKSGDALRVFVVGRNSCRLCISVVGMRQESV
jgi:hypothetical protein